MSKWTRANPLASVPGYNVPRGHFANGYTNGGDRVGFKKGGRAGAGDRKPEEFRKRREVEEKRHKRMKVIMDQHRKGHPELKERGLMKKGGWIQDVNKSIKKRGTKGKCTPITKKGCTGRAKALARTFKKMGKARKGK